MAVPVPRTWVAAEFVTASVMNADQRDTDNFLLGPPRVSVLKSANQTLTTATLTVLSFNTENYDPYATPAHDNVTNNSRLVAAEAGIYSVTHNVVFVANGTGLRNWELRKNAAGNPVGGTLIVNATITGVAAGLATRMDKTLDVQLNATDYLELFARQDSGGNLDVVGGTQADTYFQMRWAAKQ